MYTPEQIGEIDVRPINRRTIDQYSLILIQPNNDQLVVLEPCSWPKGARRAKEMIQRGIDPFDLRFVLRDRDQIETDGLPLRHLHEALWWIRRDFDRALEEGTLDDEAVELSKRYFEVA